MAGMGLAGSTLHAPKAAAEDNGVGLTPLMGWSTWNVPGRSPTAADDEAAALALKTSGLLKAGYNYVNQDDFWYDCPGSQGPDVDSYGRWVTNATEFPPGPNGENGIEVVAKYVHSLGEKFGIYVTPGISMQAVTENTPIEGTPYTADQIAEPSVHENNYNCGGMVGINYSAPGAQQFIDSWADEFASWGVDYVKVDGVGSFDIPDVEAWSNALRQTGRPIHLELSNSLNINDASTWEQYSNGWRTGGDIQCYCGNPYPLTTWSNVESRFNEVADWAPYGGPGAFNDYDSLTIGSGPAADGLSHTQAESMMSLWALGASPLVINADMTSLNPADLKILENRAVIAVDQDSIDATRVEDTSTQQVFTKTLPNGDVIAGLFNLGANTSVVSVPDSALGLASTTSGHYYLLHNLWTGATTEAAGDTISANVASDGVALFEVTKTRSAAAAPGQATLALNVPSLQSGAAGTVTDSFTNNGPLPASDVRLTVGSTTSGVTVTGSGQATYHSVAPGQTVSTAASVTVTLPSTEALGTAAINGSARYLPRGGPKRRAQTLKLSSVANVTGQSVQAPYSTYSSSGPPSAVFAESGSGTEFAISDAGEGMYDNVDQYSAIYQPSSVGTQATIQTEVVTPYDLSGYGKAGIIVRNDMTGSGTTPEGVILYASPSGGIQLEWSDNGGVYINSVTPSNGTIGNTVPVELQLVRNGDTYTGYYAVPGGTWQEVGSATVPDQASTQDAGMFVDANAGSGGEVPSTAAFDGFTITS
jgi:hypothetical protein